MTISEFLVRDTPCFGVAFDGRRKKRVLVKIIGE